MSPGMPGRLGPRYLRVAEELARKILTSRYRPGAKLPAEKQLALQSGVALLTLRRSMDELARRGLVVREHGRGTFVAQLPAAPARRVRCVMALGVSRDTQAMLQDPFYNAMIQGVEQCLSARGCDLLLSVRQGRTYAEAIRQTPHAQGVLVLGFSKTFKTELRELRRQTLPFVLLGRLTDVAGVSYVSADYEQAVYLATRWLIRQGCRRVGIPISAPESVLSANRLRGYRRALTEAGLPFNKRLVCRVPLEMDSMLDRLQTLFRTKRPPDGLVLSVIMRNAAAILDWLRARMAAGEPALPVAGFDDFGQIYSRGGMRCAFVISPLVEVGRQAAQLLLDHMDGCAKVPVRRVLPVKLVECAAN